MDILETLAEYSLVACIDTPLDIADAGALSAALRRGGVFAAEVSLALENAPALLRALHDRGLFTGARMDDRGQAQPPEAESAAWLSACAGAPLPAACPPCIPRSGEEARLCVHVTEENMEQVFSLHGKEHRCVFFLHLFSSCISARDWDAVTALCQQAVKAMLGMYLHHVGINPTALSACRQTVDALSTQFGLSQGKETPTAVFVDGFFEVMKTQGPGEKGHICVRVSCIRRAINYLETAGVKFDENSRQYNAFGELFVIYFEEQIAGFAYHLIEA